MELDNGAVLLESYTKHMLAFLCLIHDLTRSCFISFLLPSWRYVRSYRPHLEEGTPFEAMTGRTAFIESLLAEVFLSCNANARRYVHSPKIISLSSLSLETDVTDVTLRASGHGLGTGTGAGGTATLA